MPRKLLKPKSARVHTSTLKGSPAMFSNKQGAKSPQSESLLLPAQRPQEGRLHKAPVLRPLFHGGGKHNSILPTATLVRFLLTTENHRLHLPVAKWLTTKGIKEKIPLRETPSSHFPTLLSSRCSFSEENLFEDGTKSI